MSDEAAQPHSLVELIDAACGCQQCLEQYCERRMDNKLMRTLVDKAVQQDNSSRLQALMPFKLMMPDIASLAASTAALAALVPAAYSGNK